jgi:hypothetical protein
MDTEAGMAAEAGMAVGMEAEEDMVAAIGDVRAAA